ncbi:hypothetical protein [Mariprofundus sp. KV]|uniref:hypothetical protein n=1 Tax=Mariprofundus sp. KV TaxID=2608715 RepID=UPI0015A17446|nr:hypothetical protein [Mariprofundus sp. KV]NWF36670.1 hypothetical protein [Mariprofundus sp. KV]
MWQANHVLEALDHKNTEWQKEQFEKYDAEPAIDGYGFYTPIGNTHHHFNYRLTPVPQHEDRPAPDVAIARVNLNSITRLGRKPLIFTRKDTLPITVIASGYPEVERSIQKGNKLNTLSVKIAACLASIQTTADGGLLLEDTISDHKGINNLSGMSGGPIIWSNNKKFSLAGIVREGLDIQPKEGELRVEPGICIHGERITTSIFEEWLQEIPPLSELEDKSHGLYVPSSMRE